MQFKNILIEVLVRGDYQACYDFYTEKLGFVPTWGDRNGPFTAFAMEDGGETCFSISAGDNLTNLKGYVQPKTNEQPDTILGTIYSKDIEADYKRMKESGVEFVCELQHIAAFDATQAYFRDPEGNLFALYQTAE